MQQEVELHDMQLSPWSYAPGASALKGVRNYEASAVSYGAVPEAMEINVSLLHKMWCWGKVMLLGLGPC